MPHTFDDSNGNRPRNCLYRLSNDREIELFRHGSAGFELVTLHFTIKRAFADAQCRGHDMQVVVVLLEQVGDVVGFGIRQRLERRYCRRAGRGGRHVRGLGTVWLVVRETVVETDVFGGNNAFDASIFSGMGKPSCR